MHSNYMVIVIAGAHNAFVNDSHMVLGGRMSCDLLWQAVIKCKKHAYREPTSESVLHSK